MHIMNENEKKTLERRVKDKVCPLIKIEPPKGDSSWTVPDPSSYYCGADGSFLGIAADFFYEPSESICTLFYARMCRKYLNSISHTDLKHGGKGNENHKR
ncbi:hypothetical protein HYU07_03170 [Candidatus Woesearchaeota archaeon]|nr:hypothetical protein [Candidatus Woesearchaeota archaeon]